MKKVLKLALVAVMVLSSTTLFAQKLGRINTQEVLMAMPETKEAQTKLEASAKEWQENIEAAQVEFNNKFNDYQKNSATYTDAIRQMKEQELTEINQRYEQNQQLASQDMQNQQAQLMQPVYEKANNAIQKVAKANGFAAVFDLSAGPMVYYDETMMTNLMPLVYTELGIDPAAAAAKIEAANAPVAQ